MSAIRAKTTREELAAIIVRKLKEHGISAVLVGGALVSIYSSEKYVSKDLDFITSADHRDISKAMRELGFEAKGKDFVHPKSAFSVEFPAGPLALGNDIPVEPEGKKVIAGVTVKMLSPTQSVMDRLAWFYHFNDRQCLDQAVLIAQEQPISRARVIEWSKREGAGSKLDVFLKRIDEGK